MISDTAAYGWHQRNASIRSRWPRRGESCTSFRCIRGDRAALDVLLSDWAAQIRAAQPEPDSQGAISWPSRDVDAGGVFRAHGLVPALTVALRRYGSGDSSPVVTSEHWVVRRGRPAVPTAQGSLSLTPGGARPLM